MGCGLISMDGLLVSLARQECVLADLGWNVRGKVRAACVSKNGVRLTASVLFLKSWLAAVCACAAQIHLPFGDRHGWEKYLPSIYFITNPTTQLYYSFLSMCNTHGSVMYILSWPFFSTAKWINIIGC